MVRGIPVYASLGERAGEMEEAGIPVPGTVVPELDVVTIAAKAAHTQTHSHYWVVELTRAASREEVLEAFRLAPRIAFVRVSEGG